MERSDAELVQACLQEDGRAFEPLIRRYQRLVFSIASHYLGQKADVEDVAQDVFLKLYKSLASFDTMRPMKAWIARIATNRCYDELRKIKSRPQSLFSDLAGEDDGELEHLFRHFQSDSLEAHEAERMFDLLQHLLSRLPEKDRMAFVWREVEGLEYGEIAESLRTTELAVRIRVSWCKKRLVAILKEAGLGVGSDGTRTYSI